MVFHHSNGSLYVSPVCDDPQKRIHNIHNKPRKIALFCWYSHYHRHAADCNVHRYLRSRQTPWSTAHKWTHYSFAIVRALSCASCIAMIDCRLSYKRDILMVFRFAHELNVCLPYARLAYFYRQMIYHTSHIERFVLYDAFEYVAPVEASMRNFYHIFRKNIQIHVHAKTLRDHKMILRFEMPFRKLCKFSDEHFPSETAYGTCNWKSMKFNSLHLYILLWKKKHKNLLHTVFSSSISFHSWHTGNRNSHPQSLDTCAFQIARKIWKYFHTLHMSSKAVFWKFELWFNTKWLNQDVRSDSRN